MPRYRRWFVPGGTYFFTVNLIRRDSRLLTEYVQELRRSYADAAKRQPFKTIAVCVLPNHMHCIWTLPAGDSDFPGRWRRIKTGFSRALPRTADPAAGRRAGERGIWQRRYWEHVITDDDDLAARVDYIHYNPVKHGLVAALDDWPYSSWRRWRSEAGSRGSPSEVMCVGEAG